MKTILKTFFVSLLLALSLTAKADDNDSTQIKLLPITPEMETAVSHALKNCPPQGKTIHAGINKNGVYALTGDLFKNGKIYAIIDNDPIVISEWKNHYWKPLTAINECSWEETMKEQFSQEERDFTSEKPFWMLYLQSHPILAIYSGNGKNGRNYDLILFNSAIDQILDRDYSFGMIPCVDLDYLITHDSSRVKYTWGEIYYARIKNKKFVVMASWLNDTPYTQPIEQGGGDEEATYSVAKSGTNSYSIMQDYSNDKDKASWVIFKGNVCDDYWESILNAYKDNPIYAKLYLTKLKKKDFDAEVDSAYLFEKLTGLPRELYRTDDGEKVKGRLEAVWDIVVKGTPEAVKLLSPDSSSKHSSRKN